MLIPRCDQSGFSLVETLAALLVFGLVTVGILPLMLSSMRASNLNRTATVAKNLVVEATERARGLPFHREISQGTPPVPKKVDLLDMYFPRGFGGAGADGTLAANVFTVVCTSSSTQPACPKYTRSDGSVQSALPAGYTLTFRAEFVQAAAGAGGVETYSQATVPNTYYWQGAASAPGPVCGACSSAPPTEMLRLTVTASWNVGALGDRTFSTTSILGNRRFSGLRLRGAATLDSLLTMTTGFDSAGEGESSLVLTAGAAESDVEVRAVTRARYSGSAVRLLLKDNEEPLLPDVDSSGASSAQEAPSDFNLVSAATADALVSQRTDIGAFGGADDSRIGTVQGSVAVDLPRARGTAEIFGGDGDSPLGLLWVTNQIEPASNPLRIFSASRVVWLETLGATGFTSTTDSTTTATAPAASRTVSNVATGRFGNLRLFPTDFIPIDAAQPAGARGGPVIEIRNFFSEVACRATANPATPATTAASATWSATLRVWTETADNDGRTSGSYSSVSLNQNNAAAALTAIGNPMVYEDPDVGGRSPQQLGLVPNDIFLFPVQRSYDLDGDGVAETTYNHPGYLALDGWSARAGTVDVDADRRTVTAALDGALRVASSPLNPAIPASTISVLMGTLNCESVDLRP